MPRRIGELDAGAGAAKERAGLESRVEAASMVPPPIRERRDMVGFMHGIVAACAGGRPVGRVVVERGDDRFYSY
jgi:hypothetical protein